MHTILHTVLYIHTVHRGLLELLVLVTSDGEPVQNPSVVLQYSTTCRTRYYRSEFSMHTIRTHALDFSE